MNGWTDAALSSLGVEQAARVRSRLGAEPAVVAVYSSPLRRARSLGELLAAARGAALACDPELMEIGCGQLDGWEVERVRREYPLLWRRNELQQDEDFRWPGGESYREFRARCIRAIRRIVHRHPLGRVIVVTHAGVIAQLLGDVAGASPARWGAWRPGNASITTIAWHGAVRHVVAFDDRAHLHEHGPHELGGHEQRAH